MAKKTELSARISKIRSVFCDGDNGKFSSDTGLSIQLASSICTGNKPAGERTLNKILSAYPRVNKAWLFLGEGDMLRPDSVVQANVPVSTASNNVSGGILHDNNIRQYSGLNNDMLITLLENKDRQIAELIALMETRDRQISDLIAMLKPKLNDE